LHVSGSQQPVGSGSGTLQLKVVEICNIVIGVDRDHAGSSSDTILYTIASVNRESKCGRLRLAVDDGSDGSAFGSDTEGGPFLGRVFAYLSECASECVSAGWAKTRERQSEAEKGCGMVPTLPLAAVPVRTQSPDDDSCRHTPWPLRSVRTHVPAYRVLGSGGGEVELSQSCSSVGGVEQGARDNGASRVFEATCRQEAGVPRGRMVWSAPTVHSMPALAPVPVHFWMHKPLSGHPTADMHFLLFSSTKWPLDVGCMTEEINP
jgi:hypothetical protein